MAILLLIMTYEYLYNRYYFYPLIRRSICNIVNNILKFNNILRTYFIGTLNYLRF